MEGHDGGEGITAKDGSSNGKIYQNYVHHLERLGLYVDAWEKHTYNIDVFQNLVHDCANDGFTLTSEQGGLLENISVYNNGWDVGSNVWGGGISVDNPDVTNLVIRNNIVSQNLLFQIYIDVSVQNLSVDHNLIDGYREFEHEIRGREYAEGEPLFVNPSGADFHLQAASPAIDSGSPVNAPNDDFDAKKRPKGAEYDIGALEF